MNRSTPPSFKDETEDLSDPTPHPHQPHPAPRSASPRPPKSTTAANSSMKRTPKQQAATTSGGSFAVQGARFQQLLRGDRLTLLVLALVVLLVFWSGVAIGFGFSHSHDHDEALHALMLARRSSRGGPGGGALRGAAHAGGEDRINNNDDNKRAFSETVLTPSTQCCAGPAPACQACRMRISLAQYCKEHANEIAGCEDHVPRGQIFDGRVRGETKTGLVMDFPAITLSAWVVISPLAQRDIQTIVATRDAGCEDDVRRVGYALFVNEWQTEDGSVRLNWMDASHRGCQELASPKGIIKPNMWYHIAATFEQLPGAGTRAKIYVDGALVATREARGDPMDERAIAPEDRHLYVGAHGNDLYQFQGRIAQVMVAEGIATELVTSQNYKYADMNGLIGSSEARVRGWWKLDGLSAGKSAIGASGSDLDFDATAVDTNFDSVKIGATGADQFDYLVPLGPKQDIISGIWPPNVQDDDELRARSDALARQRREVVRAAMKFAYGNYEKYAFGRDELQPISGHGRDNWQGMAVTMVDALDTLWVMGMKDEFWRARDYCRDKLRFDVHRGTVSVFETNIRVLGGLLSAYDLSNDKVFLERARELGDRLLPAFNTASGQPVNTISLTDPRPHASAQSLVLAEVGTMQLEFRALSHHTGDPKYARAAEKVHTLLRAKKPPHGLYPIYVDVNTGTYAHGPVTFGALGDSFFEYLLKIWVQGGRSETAYLQDYEEAMDGMHRLIVQRSRPNGLTFLGDYQGGRVARKMDHLACFVPGMLALGAKKRLKIDVERRDRDMRVAKALMFTCMQLYQRQATGLAPEYVTFNDQTDFEVPGGAPFYILRPETVESLFILNRITGHPVYRDWGHQIMQALDKFSKVAYGYGAHPDVRSTTRRPDDRMESFFLAETLKYLFLLQDPDSEINLDDFVFNTEAHPLRVLPIGWRSKIGLN